MVAKDQPKGFWKIFIGRKNTQSAIEEKTAPLLTLVLLVEITLGTV